MTLFLPPWPLFSAFLLASFVLAVTPGPGVLYIVTRSLAQGRRVGLTSVAGVALGNLGNAVAASIGLAAIFAVSSIAFTLVKYLGATYLVYLGISTWMAPSNDAADPETTQSFQEHAFRDGFVVALLNPKTAIFFAAFLPQFVGAPEASMIQTLVLGAIFVVIAAATDSFYALAAGAVAPVLRATRGVRSFGRGITGAIFFGLGLLTAFGSNRTEVNAGVNN
jgi:threonine/homoserine/homoserine lactone efflux protein